MKLSPDDPKLTAYALGELDRADSQEIERELKDSAELRAALEEIQQTAEFLKDEFAAEKKLVLLENQREKIAAEIPPGNVVQLPKRKVAVFVGIAAMAASVMMMLGWNLWFAPKNKSATMAGNSEFRYAQNAHEFERQQREKELEKSVGEKMQGVNQESSSAKPVALTPAPAPAPVASAQPVPEITIEAKFAETSQADVKVAGQLFGPADLAFDVKNSGQFVPQAQSHGTHVAGNIGGGRGGGGSGRDETAAQPNVVPVDSLNAVGYVNLSPDELRLQLGRAIPGQEQSAPGLRTIPTKVRHIDLAQNRSSERKAAEKSREVRRGKVPILGDLPEVGRFFRSEAGELNLRLGRGETARYPRYTENSFESVRNAPLSTVSVDVDTASYANVRRFLNQNQMPPRDAVRIEELVNYFIYNYPQPRGDEPFAVNMEVAGCPWNKAHRLVRVGLKGKEIAQDKRPPSNFVFLIDVSGSMQPSERLPLIKQALRMLVKRMTENDRIAMVVYASSSGVVLESTSCMNKEKILEAIDRLEAGGSTNGGEGIQKAYALAEENFIKGGVNRVILATDGDFNVGITDQSALVNLIQKKAQSGVFLSALGVGTDNYKDALLQKLADKGNGNYHYLDTLEEAQKVLIQQMNGTLVTIAKDVKIQIEFNPAQVKSYRLIGYEKRILEAQDFNNDKKDAGEIGAGHTVTALYEIVPASAEEEVSAVVDDLKYQPKHAGETTWREKRIRDSGAESGELLTLKLRYKKPDGDTSKLLEFPLNDDGKKFSSASTDFQFAASVASFGMFLKNSEYKGNFSYDAILETAQSAKGEDKEGYRAEFINLVKKAKTLDRNDR